ncbi:hypothetical protein DPMN_089230 [Dreissena polymorpha]|uniref:Uncharacterized protein n=1 Tax=Dreissena polymorpha TaxID=45954 RepID=A0A9D4KVK0_DREPO|nr:hypothetical protein DPMN_089230 [Dreissena polymorpha]
MVSSPSGSTFTSSDLTGNVKKSSDVGLETNASPSGSTFTLPHSDITGKASPAMSEPEPALVAVWVALHHLGASR